MFDRETQPMPSVAANAGAIRGVTPPGPPTPSATATPTPTPAPASAVAGSGGVGASPAAGLGVSDDQLDRITGAYTSGWAGTKEIDPRMAELMADRKKAKAELEGQFQIVGADH